MTDPVRADFTHGLPLTVRWGEMDALGHVNNTVYYRYSEDGRIDYFSQLLATGEPFHETGPILAELGCQFRQQLRFPAEIEITTRTHRIGRSSMGVQQALWHRDGGDLVALMEAVLVWFDYRAQTSVAVPDALRERIRTFEVVPPAM